MFSLIGQRKKDVNGQVCAPARQGQIFLGTGFGELRTRVRWYKNSNTIVGSLSAYNLFKKIFQLSG